MSGRGSEIARFLADAPEERQSALSALRAICQQELGDFHESIEYGMPSYSRAADVEVAFASQKQDIALHVLRTDVVAAHGRDSTV